MKVYVAWASKNRRGGGWSFYNVLTNALKNRHVFTDRWREADVIIIPSASVITKEEYREYKKNKKRTLLRVDNALKNSRNKGAGMSRLCEMALDSHIVYQSQWARGYLSHIGEGTVIHNGIDISVFKPEGGSHDFKGAPTYIYSRASRGDTKGWHIAYSDYQEIHRQTPSARLVIIGSFESQLIDNSFDFYNGENIIFLGMISERQEMASILRGCKYMLAPYHNDCFSQTYLEALCCGVKLFCSNNELMLSGGTREMIEKFNEHGRAYFSDDRMVEEYINYIENVILQKPA